MKHCLMMSDAVAAPPAAFRRLCVETFYWNPIEQGAVPAAFRRLCVETIAVSIIAAAMVQPPLGGCVLKPC